MTTQKMLTAVACISCGATVLMAACNAALVLLTLLSLVVR